MRTALGLCLLLVPFLAMTGGMVATIGAAQTLVVWFLSLALAACVAIGIWLLMDDDSEKHNESV
jgi:hypothetical protein